MDKPTTLADVRTHIERRIRAHQTRQSRAFDSDLAGKAYEHAARANELTEILALLDRVQEGAAK